MEFKMKFLTLLLTLLTFSFSQSLRSLEINGNTYFDIKVLKTSFGSSAENFNKSTNFYFSISDDGYDFSDCDRFLFRSNLLSDAIYVLLNDINDDKIGLTGWFWWNDGIGEIISEQSLQIGWGYNLSDYILETYNQYFTVGPMIFADYALGDDLSVHVLVNYGFPFYTYNTYNTAGDHDVKYTDASFMFYNATLNYDDDFFVYLDYATAFSGNGNNRIDFGLGYHLF
jgi:hypothetical protein